MSEKNPYAAPNSVISSETNTHPNYRERRRVILRGWEKLRLRYNLILLITGILVLLLISHILTLGMAIWAACLVGIGANVCYMLGPMSESIICFYMRKTELPTYRIFAFTAGVVSSLALFASTVWASTPFYYL